MGEVSRTGQPRWEGTLCACCGRSGVGKGPRAACYLCMAELIEGLCPDECHPAFYAQRQEMAATLRAMAAWPEHPEHQAVLRAVRLLAVYPALPGGEPV